MTSPPIETLDKAQLTHFLKFAKAERITALSNEQINYILHVFELSMKEYTQTLYAKLQVLIDERNVMGGQDDAAQLLIKESEKAIKSLDFFNTPLARLPNSEASRDAWSARLRTYMREVILPEVKDDLATFGLATNTWLLHVSKEENQRSKGRS